MQYLQYNERRPRGTVDFPIEFYHIDSTHPRYAMSIHWHVEYEIIRVLEGSLRLSLDDREYRGEPGDIFFLHSGCLHAGVPGGCVYECIVFDLNMLIREGNACQGPLEDLLSGSIRIREALPREDGELRDAVWALFDALGNRGPGYQLLVQGGLYQLIGLCLRRGYTAQSATDSRHHRRVGQIKRVLQLIEASHASNLTLESLSREAGMSPKYFCRFFREMTRRTPMDYVNYYRIENACHQLITTDLSVTEIAFRCGYNDLSYFIRSFKKYKGVTPRQFLTKDLEDSTLKLPPPF